MNNAQKATLKIILLLDFAMVLYPPYEAGFGYYRRDMGHQWLFEGRGHINFMTLAAQIVIVSTIGLTIFLLAKGTVDEKFDRVLARIPLLGSLIRRLL